MRDAQRKTGAKSQVTVNVPCAGGSAGEGCGHGDPHAIGCGPASSGWRKRCSTASSGTAEAARTL